MKKFLAAAAVIAVLIYMDAVLLFVNNGQWGGV
jgi:hypothetical protein